MPYSPGQLADRSVIIYTRGALCTHPSQIFSSPYAPRVMQHFINRLVKYDSNQLRLFKGVDLDAGNDEASEAAYMLNRVMGLLVDWQPKDIRVKAPDVAALVEDPIELATMVEDLYDHWRGLERYLIFEGRADESRDRALDGHKGFIHNTEDLTNLVRSAYRRIENSLRRHWPRVYRQVPAGANMSLLIDKVIWPCPPPPYEQLQDIPMVRLALLDPPVVLYPRMNTRKGRFTQVDYNPLERVVIDPEKWLCVPVKVGQLNMLVYFDRDFLSHAVSLLNLFELAGHNDAREKPDGILVFGVSKAALHDEPTVFFEDEENDIVLGAVAKSEQVDYFGYFKKMLLTMHNVIMMRRQRLPIHGAMCRLELRSGAVCNVVIVGDSGAGKSETLEAFRILADDWLREMTIIFDDMGSIELAEDGRLIAYGTEIGAFVRLDDLDAGYAFGKLDRSIFMNPQRQNARVVLPITDYRDVVKGEPVNMLLYADNFSEVDDNNAIIQPFADASTALDIFRSGLRRSKGTTDESGLVGTYFGNPFGPEQLQERHEPIAKRFFEAAFEKQIYVGQILTRLAIPGFEREGPHEAATALFQAIGTLRENQ